MSSKEQIFSKALLLLGELPINSFTEGTTGVVASNRYAEIRDAMLTDTRWRFATGKQSLNRLTATPLNEWRYAFQIPDDVLLVIRMYPSQGYEIYEDKIYTNAASVEIDYIFRPLEPAFPAYFVEALAARLAEEIAISVTNNVTLRGEMVELAARRRAEAMHKDAQGRPNVAIQSRPFIDVRR